jgi:hypothetical protein
MSSSPIDPMFDASELVAIWFVDIPDDATLVDIINNGMKVMYWEANAQEFDY